MGLEFTGSSSVQGCLIHALVLDEKGRRCRSPRGKCHGPLELVGMNMAADALRFHDGPHGRAGRNIRPLQQAVEGEPQLSPQALERGPVRGDETSAAPPARSTRQVTRSTGEPPGFRSWRHPRPRRPRRSRNTGSTMPLGKRSTSFVWNVRADRLGYLEMIKRCYGHG